MNLPISLLAAACFLLLHSSAQAQAPEPSTSAVRAYAIVVGNNAAGPGQETLRYAESDAHRVLDVLAQLGDYTKSQSELLLTPSPTELWNAFETVQGRLEEDRAAGRESVLFFYYSGHARSSAIDLGAQQISLVDLRARIESMPASLRVVVMDACQSGAISRVKGAKPAQDFSTNSIASLSMTGLAIMASSTGAELSQESDSLKGSYFTHHLVSGLRGAADANGDGAVSLREVYDYTYHTTLLTTAVSAVGKQHATLETDLRGKGDVALTRPSVATAKLKLPDAIGGAYTVSKKRSVVAEVNKPPGQSTIVALPAGRYSILVRASSSKLRRCSVKLVDEKTTVLDWGSCVKVAALAGVEKGDGGRVRTIGLQNQPLGPQWGFEIGLDVRGSSEDAYTDRLETFGYQRSKDFFGVQGHFQLKAYRRLGAYLSLGGSMGRLQAEEYRRRTDGASNYDLRWSTWHMSALARIQKDWFGDCLQVYAEASVGLSRAQSTLSEQEMDRNTSEIYWGAAVSGSIGVVLMPLSYLGLVAGVGYGVAPTLSNELGETNNGAGVVTNFGLRTTF